MAGKITVPIIMGRKGGERIAMVTAYDTPGARIADAAGVDIILVGDSLANTVLGFEDTLRVDVETMVHHTAAVSRAKPSALVVGDMPWMSYHVSREATVVNAGRLVREGGAEAVKLEGGRKRVPMIEAIVDAEIPVMGHLGLTPQSVNAFGGFKVQGRTPKEAKSILADAVEIQDAGASLLVLECIPSHLASDISRKLDIPVIGIGAGAGTDAQVLVMHDLLGLSEHAARFVQNFMEGQETIQDGLRAFVRAVKSGEYPREEHSYS
jgi:3-methyl-2-oxobutanoate hydroxymethyltransferase